MDESGKRCCACRRVLPLDAFTRRAASRDGRQPRCRQCWAEWYRAHRDEHLAAVTARTSVRTAANRERLTAYLREHSCVDCGETDLRVLDLDHRDRSEKRGEVSRMVFRCSWATIVRELAACDVRCSNCHRRRTAAQLGWWSARAT